MSPKKILITGSNGLLGQKIVDQLINNASFALIATSQGQNRYPHKKGYAYESMDITNPAESESIICKYLPDVIINTAAMTNVDKCETERAECWKLNVTAVKSLVKICEEKNIHLIHLSTDFIFDGLNGPYKEEDKPNPLSYYADSKLASEKALTDSKIKWAIIRTILVYGVVADMSRSNIVLWAKESLEQGKSLTIVTDQWRAPTLSEDLASACISAAKKNATGIFHVSGKNIMSIFEMVNQVAKFWGLNNALIKPISSDTLNVAAKRPLRTGFILNKAHAILDYTPHSFTEGLLLIDRQLKEINNFVK